MSDYDKHSKAGESPIPTTYYEIRENHLEDVLILMDREKPPETSGDAWLLVWDDLRAELTESLHNTRRMIRQERLVRQLAANKERTRAEE